MGRFKDWILSDQFQQRIYPEIKRFLAVIFFTTIYGFGVVWFLEASIIPMYTGGIPGIAQLLRDFIVYRTNWQFFSYINEEIFLGLAVILLNIPVLILGWFGVSKKFTLYSLVSILIQATMLGFIPQISLGLNSLEHALTTSILAAILIGIGTGGALRFGTSTGGLDILAQYWSFKKGQSVGILSMTMNIGIAVLGGIIANGKVEVAGGVVAGGVIVSYTILRNIISTVVTDRIHTAYQFISVDIITEDPDNLIQNILVKLYRGVTLYSVRGAYSKKEKISIFVVISSYELHTLSQLVQQLDPKAFMITRPVKQVIGNFKRKTIA